MPLRIGLRVNEWCLSRCFAFRGSRTLERARWWKECGTRGLAGVNLVDPPQFHRRPRKAFDGYSPVRSNSQAAMQNRMRRIHRSCRRFCRMRVRLTQRPAPRHQLQREESFQQHNRGCRRRRLHNVRLRGLAMAGAQIRWRKASIVGSFLHSTGFCGLHRHLDFRRAGLHDGAGMRSNHRLREHEHSRQKEDRNAANGLGNRHNVW